ncbi:AAA family ATPase [Streptosporangium soli]|nr:kinase [Streptosporangium sp. KLBMP 9127]
MEPGYADAPGGVLDDGQDVLAYREALPGWVSGQPKSTRDSDRHLHRLVHRFHYPARVKAGAAETRLIVIRGNSGSGKTSVARSVRETHGRRGLALVSQDVIRRELLRELDVPGGVNIGLLDTITRHALDHGYHVILEGILTASRYEEMLAGLHRDHAGRTCFFYLDVPFGETLRRHALRPQHGQFGEAEMRDWYRERDLLARVAEAVIGQDSTLTETVELILHQSGLARAEPVPEA